MLSKNSVKSYQRLAKKYLGVSLTDKEALDEGISLLRLMQLIWRPMTKKEFALVQARRKELGIPYEESPP